MANGMSESNRQDDLRMRALTQLTGRGGGSSQHESTSAALGVLYELASTPATAASALALLHELQVHQVELELQDDELRRARVELEVELARRRQLYDSAPVGYFTVDADAVLSEVNPHGARLLGAEPAALYGRSLDAYLAPHSGRALRTMFSAVTEHRHFTSGPLQLLPRKGDPRIVHASVDLDPAGGHFLLVLVALGGDDDEPVVADTRPS
jgi:PAS domain S-box-containing protein